MFLGDYKKFLIFFNEQARGGQVAAFSLLLKNSKLREMAFFKEVRILKCTKINLTRHLHPGRHKFFKFVLARK